MADKLNLNQSPYFDDYNEDKKFHRILFRPGRAVQARELNQIQSALQTQIERMGKHLFENGAQVLPGSKEGIKYDDLNGFVKIPATENSLSNSSQNLTTYWLDKTIKCTATADSDDGKTGVIAKVIGFFPPDAANEARLVLTYLQASVDGTKTSFVRGDTIETVEEVPQNQISAVIPDAQGAVGRISSVTVEQSVYFFEGNFILVDEQRLFITPPADLIAEPLSWNNTPTALVGLKITQSIITARDDESLYDNAIGSPNFSAPGADRLRVDAQLIQVDIENDDPSFIPLVRVVDGLVRARVVDTDYGVLEETLARRTFDESGDYTVDPFQIQIKDFLNDGENNGAHSAIAWRSESRTKAAEIARDVFGLSGDATDITFQHTDNFYYPTANPSDGYNSFLDLCSKMLSIKIDPGKAYVRGFKIEKLGTEIINIPRARSLKHRNNKTISTPLGIHFYVTDMFGVPGIQEYSTVELHSKINTSTNGTNPGAKIGTAKVLSVDFFNGTTGPKGTYRLFLFDIKIDAGKRIEQLKSFYSAGSNTFTCNCVPQVFRLTGSVSPVAGTGAARTLKGVGTSWKNDELQRIRSGDYVRVQTLSGGIQSTLDLLVADDPANDNELNITLPTAQQALFDNIIDGSTIDFIEALPRGNDDGSSPSLVFSLPDSFVYSLRRTATNPATSASTVDTTFSLRRVEKTNETPTDGTITISVLAPGEEFEDFSTSGYLVVNRSTGNWMQLIPAGTPAAGQCVVQPAGNSITFTFNSADTNGNTNQFYIVCPIILEGGDSPGPGDAVKERTKTLIKGNFNGAGNVYQGTVVVTGSNADVKTIPLGKADILRITRVVESPNSAEAPSAAKVLPAGHKNITHKYILDNGQRDFYYDLGSAILRPGESPPKGRVRVEFDYFTHGQVGSFFSVDSYPTEGTGSPMSYDEIPDFVSSDGTRYDLASAIDFRPRINDDDPTDADFGQSFSTNLQLPKDNFRCDYHFFLGRADKLYLSETGKFTVIQGVPDELPQLPEDPEFGMVLYELELLPYTSSPQSVFPRMRDNKRYTMRDIGKLEKRIKNLEYYTSLSMLEADTNSLEIKDALGNNKFKNGFLVDNFSTFSGDLGTTNYRAAVDTQAGEARPIISEHNVGLFEKILLNANESTRASLRDASNYQKTGQLITLPYKHVVLTEQSKASKVSNVNPFAVFTWVGSVSVSPWSDEWRETKNLEPLNIQDSGAWDLARQSFGPTGTKIDYTQTSQFWTGLSVSEPTPTGRNILLAAGHDVREKLSRRERRKQKKDGGYIVPEGFANAGERVPGDKRSWVAPEMRVTTTLTGKEITTNFTSTFKDLGFSSPVSMGSRLIDTSMIEYIRPRVIKFQGKGFMPGARVYPYFDDVDVSAECAQVPNNTADETKTLIDGLVGAVDTKSISEALSLLNTSFGQPLLCDGRGRVSGIFIIPGAVNRRFKTGERLFRLTTSDTNEKNPAPKSAGEAAYTAKGYIDTKQETTYSTRAFTVDRGATVASEQAISQSSDVFFPGKPCPKDPIAQSFFVNETGGCFITAIDVFFYARPTGDQQPNITLQVRMLDAGGTPSNKIVPFGEVVKESVEVITNRVDLVRRKMTVTGYRPRDEEGDPTAEYDDLIKEGTIQITGPWPTIADPTAEDLANIENISNQSGREIVSGVEFDLTTAGSATIDMIPTRFVFESPIYLDEKESYCFVLLSDSDEYKVWVAQSGFDIPEKFDSNDRFREAGELNTEIGTDTTISKDPYVQGVYFKSQNGLTWTDDQSVDIKFKIWKAEFDIDTNGEVEYVNFELPLKQLPLDPFETASGENVVRVMHSSHGHTIEGLGSRASKAVFQPKLDRTLSGTLSIVGDGVGATTVNGTGTAFLSELNVGSMIQHPQTGQMRRVASIANDTTLTLETGFANGLSSTSNVAATSYVVPDRSALNGFRAEELFQHTGHDVIHVELDSYVIELSDAATGSGSVGGGIVLAGENRRFEELTLLTTELERPGTSIDWNIQTTSSRGVTDNTNAAYNVLPRRNLSPYEKIIFDAPMQVSSYINETNVSDTLAGPSKVTSTALGDKKSLNIRAVLKSNNKNLTPVLDESRFSVQLISNRMDDPRGTESEIAYGAQVINKEFDNLTVIPTNVAPQITATETKSAIHFSSNANDKLVIKTADGDIAKHLSNLDVGKFLSCVITDDIGVEVTSSNSFEDKLILSVSYTPLNTVADTALGGLPAKITIIVDHDNSSGSIETNVVTLTQKNRYIDEIAPSGGSCAAKYCSKKLTISRPANALRVSFDAYRDETVSLELYYRLEPSNSPVSIDDINWTLAEYNLDVNGTVESLTPAPNKVSSQFSAYECTLTELPAYVGVQAKIVMRGGNPARPPLIKNFRMISLDE